MPCSWSATASGFDGVSTPSMAVMYEIVFASIEGLFCVHVSGIWPEHVDDARDCALIVVVVKSEMKVAWWHKTAGLS